MNFLIIFEAKLEKSILEVLMKHFKTILVTTAIMALSMATAHAQYVTSHAKIAVPGQQNGLYYSLPRTVVQLDFIVEEIELLEGPYREYVYMVGADDYVSEDGMEYRLADIQMSTYAEADPNATFFVAMNTKKSEGMEFSLTPKGILQGVGVEKPSQMEQPKTYIIPNPPTDSDRTFKYQYGSNGTRGKEQLARSASEMLSRIREEKIKLITGFQETAFTLDTYRQMLADLEEMENEYLSLFIGKRIITTTVKTVYITPTKEVPTQTIGKFSTATGFSTNYADSGTPITLQAISLNTTSGINGPSPSAVESLFYENKLFYRIPEIAYLKVSLGDNVLLEKRETIAQLGALILTPLGKTRMSLDPNTGQITSMGMK